MKKFPSVLIEHLLPSGILLWVRMDDLNSDGSYYTYTIEISRKDLSFSSADFKDMTRLFTTLSEGPPK